MPRTVAEIRASAKAHAEEIESINWLTPADLAARWNVALSTVHAIPYEQLKYKTFGNGKKLKRRRYHPDWVAAYEALPETPVSRMTA